MFQRKVARTKFQAAIELGSVVYHMTAREARGPRGHAGVGLMTSMGTTVLLMLGMAAIMIYGMGVRSNPVHGDFILFLMTGITLYMMHIRTFRAVARMGGEGAGTMKHTQVSTPVNILSGAFSTLYMQILSILCILFAYHAVFSPLTIEHPVQAMGMVMMSWLTAVCVGLVFIVLTPWSPMIMMRLQTLYIRANFLASGKMILGNSLSASALKFFDWNPLFHIIDQMRGFVFVNYVPRNSDPYYPLYVCLVLLVVGLMFEFVTRRSVSASWGKKRF
ncbi:MAG: ABC transporter permease [Deltaproteobacteria bacterium]